MFDKDLKLDGKLLKKQKKIRAKRPSEYWLLFFKKYILIKRSAPFRLRYLLFVIPIVLLIIFLLSGGNTSENFMPVIFISFFISIFGNIFLAQFLDKNSFIDTNSYNHLAKFIIDTKGDIYKNVINLRLNFDTLEQKKYELSPSRIGITSSRQTKYYAYQTERYNAALIFKDGSFCNVALHQISLKVKTTKRRSSGKVKTKYKFKHKLFYSLVLKLKASDYKSISANQLKAFQNVYNITIQEDNNLLILKIKYKEKLHAISSSVSTANKQQTSIYTKMLEYLIAKKIVVSKTSNALLSQ